VALVVASDPNLAATLNSLVSANLSETQSEKSSWEWRVQGYAEATDRVFAGDATDTAIGPPAGWAANSNAAFASTHIHDRYIDTLAYYGVIGLAILLMWLGILAKRVSQRRRLVAAECFRGDTGSTFLQALLLSEVVYLIPYFGGILQGTALGLIWLAASHHVLPPRTKYTVKVRAARLRNPELATR
jgi:O-antigen ligase